MFLRNNKGQVSIELLIVLGLIIIGAIIFATNYLSLINKNVDDATTVPSAKQINRYIEDTVNVPTISPVRTNSEDLCGNGELDPLEVCDIDSGGVFPSDLTCEYITGSLGTLNCSADCLKITCS